MQGITRQARWFRKKATHSFVFPTKAALARVKRAARLMGSSVSAFGVGAILREADKVLTAAKVAAAEPVNLPMQQPVDDQREARDRQANS